MFTHPFQTVMQTVFPHFVHMYSCTNCVFAHPVHMLVQTMFLLILYVHAVILTIPVHTYVQTYKHLHNSVLICTVQTVLQLYTCYSSCTYVGTYVRIGALSDIYVRYVLVVPVYTVSTMYSI